jgi:hypothetical protein
MQALNLHLARRTAFLLEIQPDLPDGDDLGVGRKIPQRLKLGTVWLGRMMPDPRPHLGVLPGQVDSNAAPLEVDSHGDQARHAGGGRLRDDLGGVSELFQMEVRVDEAELYFASPSIRFNSSSTTFSSSFLKSACGSRSFWPAGRCVGFQTGS